MGNRVWKGEPSAGGRAGTIIALGIAALVVAGYGSDGLDTRAIVRFRICRRRSRSHFPRMRGQSSARTRKAFMGTDTGT